jgi:type IV secretory pathway TraG/TraD family ATPase VirD4
VTNSNLSTNTNLNQTEAIKPNGCYLAVFEKDNKAEILEISRQERRKHLYIIGKTGMGKTTLIQNMVLQDIYAGNGVCLIDPHGDSSEYVMDRIPSHRHNDVVYIDPSDKQNPVALNVLEAKNGEEKFLIASSMMAVFNKIWSGMWSSRMEYILNNTLLALLEQKKSTLLGVLRILTDDKYREKLVYKIQDPVIKNFWLNEFAKFNSRYRQEAISPILNKVGQFLSTEIIRNILGQSKSSINLREIMDDKKILIVNVSKGKLGEDNSNLLGSLILAKLQIAAMGRVDQKEEKRQDFYLYVDEFQNFTNDSFASILSEARKYRLNLILAHQYISQLTENGNFKVKNAIFGNVSNLIVFRLGAQDAPEIIKELNGKFTIQDIINLKKAQVIVQISDNGSPKPATLAISIPPIFEKLNGNRQQIIEMSRSKYSRDLPEVEKEINEQLGFDKNTNEELEVKKEPEKTTKLQSKNILEIKSAKRNVKN